MHNAQCTTYAQCTRRDRLNLESTGARALSRATSPFCTGHHELLAGVTSVSDGRTFRHTREMSGGRPAHRVHSASCILHYGLAGAWPYVLAAPVAWGRAALACAATLANAAGEVTARSASV